ncbi:hypothetical protein SPRG_00529 [Saprolegnia parasitica CBS 223.65]|uniref:Carbohydrate kinase PfkB domain-containing protein n=1 Tax=Saprolegnia parasitica (strain CBS 223.65) TaxID=695850 RepID=A0A067CYW2_SAPPC|nr:hypothetical protein SPRG_00529 [Saprolegnia parasitica CBS 223.65]KDO34465.1 hypothetical protein SPRG_00529 [Saprolegnia parasitica CBS 223.65]|eukprot:XP_012194146.1 hypothetical protein SPRG_00529 [Saprolegnia parasitica CBS 223.65]
MACVVVGIATMDVVHRIPGYPDEDTKTRIRATRKARGGNGTNVLIVSAQLACFASYHWIGSLVDPSTNADARFIVDDLSAHGVYTSSCQVHASGSMPTSHILLSDANGSRTIFHHRELPEVSDEHVATALATLVDVAWIHFECREAQSQLRMIRIARATQPHATISLEVEGPRHAWDDVQPLLSHATYAFIAQGYVTSLGYATARDFFHALATTATSELRAVVVPWGSDGAFVWCTATNCMDHVPVDPIPKPLDTVGAGDTLVGATISALGAGLAIQDAVAIGCRVARTKCLQIGLEFEPTTLDTFRDDVVRSLRRSTM